jgi:thioredoxin reductase
MENIYDVIIIGLGPAGYSAAIYSDRYKLKTLIIGEKVGGTMTEAWEISNFPSYEKISGIEFTKKMQEQLKNKNTEIKQEIVKNIKKEKNNFLIETETSKYYSKSIILC